VTRAGVLLRRRWGDALVVAAFVLGLGELVWRIPWAESGDTVDLTRASPWIAAPFVALWTLPLLFRRRSGLIAGSTCYVAAAAVGVLEPDATDSVVLYVTLLGASAVIGLHEDRRGAIAGGIVTLAAVIVLIRAANGYLAAGDVFVGVIFAWGPLTAGQIVRSITERNALLAARTEELERLQAEQAAAAAVEERTRIANELHGVIAQGVDVMTVQATAARSFLLTDPERARTAVLAVERAGREALTETRRLLGVLRQDDSEPQLAPQPGVRSLQALVDREEAHGLPVLLVAEGEPRVLPASAQMTVFRVVDEALTAARGHEGITRASVTLRWRAAALELEIADDGLLENGGAPARDLRASLSERLRLHGGSVDATVLPDGTCPVKVRIPMDDRT
jgi:signal transduction histidine kinase